MPPRLPDTVEHWLLDRLIPHARNARTHDDDQVAQIAASIVEFGWTNPILVDAEGVGRLYRGRVRRGDLMWLIVATLITMGIIIAISDAVRLDLYLFWQWLQDQWANLRRAIF